MTTLAGRRERNVPVELLTRLRAARATRTADDNALAATLGERGLRPLSGGRNNDVFAWHGPDGQVCIKLYKKTDRLRVQREWHGLRHTASLGCAPEPLWLDDNTDQPALGMSLLPGTPILDTLDPATAINSLAQVTQAMQDLPLTGPLADLERIDSIGHYIARLTDVWPGQLADAADDALTAGMLALLHRWADSADPELLAKPAPRTFSRGDANLLNWLHNGEHTFVVDFEFSGHSDPAVDAADHIEHLSARAIPDHNWTRAETDLGITSANRPRFHAAQRTIALRWLAVLWKQRTKRVAEFTAQYERVRALLG